MGGTRLVFESGYAPRFLLLDDGTLLALVGVVLVALLLVFAGLVLAIGSAAGWWRRVAAPEPDVALGAAARREPLVKAPRGHGGRPVGLLRGVEIDVPTKHVDAIVAALKASGWLVRETGDVVATDEDEEGLTTLAVDYPLSGRPIGSGEEIR